MYRLYENDLLKQKGSKDILKRSALENNYILVARDTNETGSKAYRLVEPSEWLKQTALNNLNEYECLYQNVSLYMDIETKDMTINKNEMIESLINNVGEIIESHSINIISVAIADSSTTSKHSFHAIFNTNKSFGTTVQLSHFIYEHVKPNIKSFNNCIDYNVYTTDRLIRFINQSKFNKTVVLTPTIINCNYKQTTDYESFLICNYKKDKPCFVIESAISDNNSIDETDEMRVIYQIAQEYFDKLATIISNDIIQNMATCLRFICAMKASGAENDLIHKHCQRTTNYDRRWVSDVISRANHYNIGIGTLIRWANQENKVETTALYIKYILPHKQTIDFDFKSNIETLSYNKRYVEPLKMDYSTQIINSPMGSGKTTQVKKLLSKNPNIIRCLVLTSRKSFASFMTGELNTFVNYSSPSLRGKDLSQEDKLIIQVESLWKLQENYKPYDLVFIDESESVLFQMTSIATHKEKIIKNYVMIEKIVSEAKMVILADAFISKRSIQFCEFLRDVDTTLLINNTFQPYERKATLLQSINSKGDAQPAIETLYKKMFKDLKDGLKIVFVSTTVKGANNFIEEYLKKSKFSYKFYQGNSCASTKKELEDVELHWSDIDIIIYTLTITVGINYNPISEIAKKDKLYLYTFAETGLQRDIVQALLRVREIKTNELIYTVNTGYMNSRTIGIDNIRLEKINDVKDLLQKHPEKNWMSFPKWGLENFVNCVNEESFKNINYIKVLNEYLIKSGYTLSVDNQCSADGELIKKKTLPYGEIPLINNIEYENMIKYENDDDTQAEHDLKINKILKYKLAMNLKTNADIEKCWNWIYDVDNINQEACFWNMVSEKHKTTEHLLDNESYTTFAETVSKKLKKRVLLDKVLKTFDMNNSCEVKKIDVNLYLDQIQLLENDILNVFDTSNHSKKRRKTDFTARNAKSLIRKVFSSWNGVKPECNQKRIVVDKVRKSTYVIDLKEHFIWDCINDRY